VFHDEGGKGGKRRTPRRRDQKICSLEGKKKGAGRQKEKGRGKKRDISMSTGMANRRGGFFSHVELFISSDLQGNREGLLQFHNLYVKENEKEHRETSSSSPSPW